MTIYLIFNDLMWTDTLTHWPTQPPTHTPIQRWECVHKSSSNRIELSRLDKVLLKFLWFHIFQPTNPPPTHQKNTHPWVGESPQIPNLQTESKYLNSFKFYCILEGYPPGGWVGGWVGGGGVGWGHPHTHVHKHAHARTCTHTCMHVKHGKHGCLHGGSHLQFPNMFILAFHACACMHVHVHMSRDTPHALRCPPTHLPPPQIHREPKSPKFISPELIEIFRFCLKNLYLWTFLNSSRLTLITLHTPHPPAPPPWSWRSWNLKSAIKHERIEIIEFRLKICDPWALLHTYRLDLMHIWGGVYHPKWHFYVSGPKNVHVFHSCDSLDKKFLVFALDPTRPCLDWQLSRFLTSQPINEPFKFDLKWRPNWKIWLKSQFAKEPSTIEIFEMYPGML